MYNSVELIPGTAHIQYILSPVECNRLVDEALQWEKREAEIYTSKNEQGHKDHKTRKGSVYNCPTDQQVNQWWKSKIDQAFIHYLRKYYQPAIDWGTLEVQMVEYFDQGDKFGRHQDVHIDINSYGKPTRKLSMSLELSSPSNYTGCQLKFFSPGGDVTAVEPGIGHATIFPSWQKHEVTPIKSGIRRALVVWYHGPFWS